MSLPGKPSGLGSTAHECGHRSRFGPYSHVYRIYVHACTPRHVHTDILISFVRGGVQRLCNNRKNGRHDWWLGIEREVQTSGIGLC